MPCRAHTFRLISFPLAARGWHGSQSLTAAVPTPPVICTNRECPAVFMPEAKRARRIVKYFKPCSYRYFHQIRYGACVQTIAVIIYTYAVRILP